MHAEAEHADVEVRLHEINQLFNSLDPSPFQERDLDADAEEFIVAWARDLPDHRPLRLIIHLTRLGPRAPDEADVQAAVRNNFAARAALAHKSFRELLRRGRKSLLIGLAFLAACTTAVELLELLQPALLVRVLREGLVIAGWVGMWRPFEIYLYEWWPLLGTQKLFDRLSAARVELRVAPANGGEP